MLWVCDASNLYESGRVIIDIFPLYNKEVSFRLLSWTADRPARGGLQNLDFRLSQDG